MHVDKQRTRIVFFGRFQIVEFAVLSQILCTDDRHIHECHGFFRFSVHVDSHIGIGFKRRSEKRSVCAVFDFNVRQFRKESRMPAVIRPIRIEHADFRFRRISSFLFKIILHEFDIGRIHCKRHALSKRGELAFIHADKSRNGRNV